MGLGGISIWQLAIILAIAIVLFGTKRLKNIGADVGESIKGFRKSMNTDDETPPPAQATQDNVIDAQAQVTAKAAPRHFE